MGFPVGYSELLFPKLFLRLLLFLGSVRHVILWAFHAVGLGELVDPDHPWPDPSPASTTALQARRCEYRSMPSLLIQELLPVVRYEELPSQGDSCAVCLCELETGEEVRRLSNCRHVYHRGCLDRWIEHEQCTCPLCRAPLVPDEAAESFNNRIWAAAGLPDSLDYDNVYGFDDYGPSPTLLLPHQLLSSS